MCNWVENDVDIDTLFNKVYLVFTSEKKVAFQLSDLINEWKTPIGELARTKTMFGKILCAMPKPMNQQYVKSMPDTVDAVPPAPARGGAAGAAAPAHAGGGAAGL